MKIVKLNTLTFLFQVSSRPFGSGEVQIDFQDGGHLGFLIRLIVAIFYLQVAPIFPTKFQVS